MLPTKQQWLFAWSGPSCVQCYHYICGDISMVYTYVVVVVVITPHPHNSLRRDRLRRNFTSQEENKNGKMIQVLVWHWIWLWKMILVQARIYRETEGLHLWTKAYPEPGKWKWISKLKCNSSSNIKTAQNKTIVLSEKIRYLSVFPTRSRIIGFTRVSCWRYSTWCTVQTWWM